MPNSNIRCPHCNGDINLDASLIKAAEASVRAEMNQENTEKTRAQAKRDRELDEREKQLQLQASNLEHDVSERTREAVTQREAELRAVAERRAQEIVESLIHEKDEKIDAKDSIIDKLMASNKQFREEREGFEAAKKTFDIKVDEKVREQTEVVRRQVVAELTHQHKLELAEKDKTIGDVKKQMQDGIQKASQGSQQLQGEVQEQALEEMLKSCFSLDEIQPVSAGRRGADIEQQVRGRANRLIGSILWESKRTKVWQKQWIAKLKEDQMTCGAQVCVLVTQAMPSDLEGKPFGIIEGVFVTTFASAIPVASLLRQHMDAIDQVRQSNLGRETKVECVYDYLTGPEFQARVESVAEAIQELKDDHEKEKMAITKRWARKEKLMTRAIGSMLGMHGDLQGIAGASIPELAQVKSFEIPDDA